MIQINFWLFLVYSLLLLYLGYTLPLACDILFPVIVRLCRKIRLQFLRLKHPIQNYYLQRCDKVWDSNFNFACDNTKCPYHCDGQCTYWIGDDILF